MMFSRYEQRCFIKIQVARVKNASLCFRALQETYGRDMSPCDYDLFSKIKEPLEGIQFQSRVDIQRVLNRSVREISRNAASDGVHLLPRIWQHIVDLEVDYK